MRDKVRRHPDPDIKFTTFNTMVDYFVSISDDPVLGTKILGALPREILNLYLVEWNNSIIKTPLPGQDFKIKLAPNPFEPL